MKFKQQRNNCRTMSSSLTSDPSLRTSIYMFNFTFNLKKNHNERYAACLGLIKIFLTTI